MNFKLELFKQILATIENKLQFISEGVDKPQSFDMKCAISAEEIIKLYSNNDVNDVKYCLFVLKQSGYISMSNSSISITPNGYKFILNTLHNVHCIY